MSHPTLPPVTKILIELTLRGQLEKNLFKHLELERGCDHLQFLGFHFFNFKFEWPISKFQSKKWPASLSLCSGMWNLLVVLLVWPWRVIFRKWRISSKSVTSNEKPSIPQNWQEIDILQITYKMSHMCRLLIWYNFEIGHSIQF